MADFTTNMVPHETGPCGLGTAGVISNDAQGYSGVDQGLLDTLQNNREPPEIQRTDDDMPHLSTRRQSRRTFYPYLNPYARSGVWTKPHSRYCPSRVGRCANNG